MKLWHLAVAAVLIWYFFLRGKTGTTPPATTPPATPGIPTADAQKVTP
jgi:hypothetical protein